MPFKKGDKNINRKGRPVGSSERIKKIRDKILDLIETDFETLQADFNKLEGKDRLIILDKLLKHVLPKPPEENLLENFTEADLDKLIGHLKKQLHEKR